MPREKANVRTANHVAIKLDGQQIGLMQNLRASDDYGLEPVSGIGDIHVAEHVPTIARHQLSVSFACLRRDLLVSRGFVPENGTDALRGLVFDVEVFDKRDSEMVKKYTDCSYSSGDISFDAHRVIVRNASFMAIDTTGKI
jgi:hypothetical protein